MPSIEFKDAPALHLWIEHFQGSAAGADLVVMGEIGEAFEDAGRLDPDAVIGPVPGEWHPLMPERLDEEELAA